MPYNPGTSYVGSHYVAQAAASNPMALLGMQMIGRAMQEQERDKERSREFKALQAFATEGLKIPKEKTDVMDLDSLRGFVRGTVAKQEFEKAALATEAAKVNLALGKLRLDETADLRGFARDMATGDVAGQVPQSRYAEALARGDLFMPGATAAEEQAAGAAPLADRLQFAMGRHPLAAASPQSDNLIVALARLGAMKSGNGNGAALGYPMNTGVPGMLTVPTSQGRVQLVPNMAEPVTARPVYREEKGGKVLTGYMVGNAYHSKDDFEDLPKNEDWEPQKDTEGGKMPIWVGKKTGRVVRNNPNPLELLMQLINPNGARAGMAGGGGGLGVPGIDNPLGPVQ